MPPLNDYSIILKQELQSRVQRNPRYSLRAFSRDLGISSARLSRIMSGKGFPSRATAMKIGQQLGYKGEKLEWYCALVEVRHARTDSARQAAQTILRRYENGIATRNFAVKSSIDWNWYHFAVRRLTQIAGFHFDYEWISKALGISLGLTRRIIEELLKVGALAVVEGRLHLRENYSIHFNGDKSETRKKMELELFKRRLPSILNSDRSQSHHARHFFVIHRSQYDELRRAIREFEDRIDDLTYRTKEANDLVCLSIDLWSLLRNR